MDPANKPNVPLCFGCQVVGYNQLPLLSFYIVYSFDYYWDRRSITSTCIVDALAQFAEEDFFFDLLECHIKDLGTVLELYKASQIMTCSKEPVLEKLNSWSSHFLQQELSKDAMHVDGYQNYIKEEVISIMCQ